MVEEYRLIDKQKIRITPYSPYKDKTIPFLGLKKDI